MRSVETVVVGAGQSGLLMSDHLRQAGREHVLLERRSTLGGGWQDRWDAFCLVGPNWTTSMPSFPYPGDDPDGFMTRDELIDQFRAYGAAIDAPVEFDTDVTRLTTADARPGPARSGAARSGAARFHVTTNRGEIEAREVIVAGGPFQTPFIPPVADGFGPSIDQVHAHHYRNAAALAPGGVLVVGTGQSGVQLAEELRAAGRDVTLSVGHCWRAPRRYRGKDIFWWLHELATTGRSVGVALPTVDKLPDPRARFACNPHLSGHGGGHEMNLRRMGAEGTRLVGRLTGADGTLARFAPDLEANLLYADTWFDERVRALCDGFAERIGADLPSDELSQVAFDPPPVAELDLAAEGISTVLWTSGYRPDFTWLELPVFDTFGLPIQREGATDVPGLSFIGTPWLVDMTSGNLLGVGRDAEMLAARW